MVSENFCYMYLLFHTQTIYNISTSNNHTLVLFDPGVSGVPGVTAGRPGDPGATCTSPGSGSEGAFAFARFLGGLGGSSSFNFNFTSSGMTSGEPIKMIIMVYGLWGGGGYCSLKMFVVYS